MDYEFEKSERIILRGRLAGESDFASLIAKLPARATLDLSGITRINSSGVREWLGFVRSVPPDKRLILERCPVIFVDLLNIIREFAGPATIRSVYVPHLCKGCGQPRDCLVDLPLKSEAVPPAREACSKCGGKLEPDVDVETFFAFERPRETIS